MRSLAAHRLSAGSPLTLLRSPADAATPAAALLLYRGAAPEGARLDTVLHPTRRSQTSALSDRANRVQLDLCLTEVHICATERHEATRTPDCYTPI
jgi:hypothetical protein